MNFEQQRMWAEILVENAKPPMTLAALRDPETCFEGILTTALAEVGADRLGVRHSSRPLSLPLNVDYLLWDFQRDIRGDLDKAEK
jgi:hypothetical protein